MSPLSHGPAAVPLTLSSAEREALRRWIRRRTTAQALALRARIVLACAEPGASNTAVARALGVSRPTVITWRGRFAVKRLDGLLDEPRPGAPRTITDADVERVLVTTLETTPRQATHWSTRLLADERGLSETAIRRSWRARAVPPPRREPVTCSRDPLLLANV